MRAALEDRSVKQAVVEFQRIALGAAVIGCSMSLTVVILYFATQRIAGANAGMRSALEAICVVPWPSAILMLGTQTYHGGIVLFLLSACLNTGYFVLATMVSVIVIQRLNFTAASTSKVSAVPGEFSDRPLSESLRRARPVA